MERALGGRNLAHPGVGEPAATLAPMSDHDPETDHDHGNDHSPVSDGGPGSDTEPGSDAEPGSETQPGSDTQPGSATEPGSDTEPGLVRLDPRVRSLWWTAGGLQAILFTLVIAPVDRFAPLPWPTWWLTGGVAVATLALAAIVPAIRYRRWGYALREGDLWIRQGVLWVSVSVIPYSRLQFVDTRQGPLDRLFGLSQLVVHTAALGTSGRLPGLDAAEAEHLRERLAAVESDVIAV